MKNFERWENLNPWLFPRRSKSFIRNMKKNITKKEFQVPSLLSEVQKASEQVLQFLKPLALSEALVFDIRLCLEEALINAMKYGNKLNEDLAVKLDVELAPEEI